MRSVIRVFIPGFKFSLTCNDYFFFNLKGKITIVFFHFSACSLQVIHHFCCLCGEKIIAELVKMELTESRKTSSQRYGMLNNSRRCTKFSTN